MVIAGAGGHAREILDVLNANNYKGKIYLFENLSTSNYKLFNYDVITGNDELAEILAADPDFILGTGTPLLRHKLNNLITSLGGKLNSVIAQSSLISASDTQIANGCNIMAFSFISNRVKIGEGALVNTRANLHHDVTVGDYCEISPAATILGNATIGHFTAIGSGAVILPDIIVGNHCIIGAGAVVTCSLPDYSLAVGVPAKVVKTIPNRQ